MNGATPDNFTTSIALVLRSFEALGPIEHRPLSPEEAEPLRHCFAGSSRRDEASATSDSRGHKFHFSGHLHLAWASVHLWIRCTGLGGVRDYCNGTLPELRLPVDSFEHFCLLLEKDPTTINTALHRKTSEELLLQPFEDESFLKACRLQRYQRRIRCKRHWQILHPAGDSQSLCPEWHRCPCLRARQRPTARDP